jgi:hypothetical protein
MQKLRLLVVLSLPILVLGAVGTTSAPAAEYSTSSAPANSSVPVAEVVPVTKSFKMTATGISVIVCSKVQLVGASAVNDTNKATMTSVRFSSCENETEPTKCAINTIETKPIAVTLEDTVGGKTVEKSNHKPEQNPPKSRKKQDWPNV